VQISRLGDLTQSRARLSRSLEARAPRLAILAESVLRAFELCLSALHFAERPLFGTRHRRNTKTRNSEAAPASKKSGPTPSAAASGAVRAMWGIEAGGFSAIDPYVQKGRQVHRKHSSTPNKMPTR
jgi:hypothetical protein